MNYLKEQFKCKLKRIRELYPESLQPDKIELLNKEAEMAVGLGIQEDSNFLYNQFGKWVDEDDEWRRDREIELAKAKAKALLAKNNGQDFLCKT